MTRSLCNRGSDGTTRLTSCSGLWRRLYEVHDVKLPSRRQESVSLRPCDLHWTALHPIPQTLNAAVWMVNLRPCDLQ